MEHIKGVPPVIDIHRHCLPVAFFRRLAQADWEPSPSGLCCPQPVPPLSRPHSMESPPCSIRK